MALAEGADQDISIPSSQPESGLPILAHKLWVGNIDKRITELVNIITRARDILFPQKAVSEDIIISWKD